MALTERAKARSTRRFSVSEADVLGERELQNRYALIMYLFKRAGNNLSVRKIKCPVTPCVPACLDRRYSAFHDLSLTRQPQKPACQPAAFVVTLPDLTY
jgi:hypothetical protein